MGLDMYLYREHYVQNWDHQTEAQRHTISIRKGGEPVPEIDTSRISYIREQVGYWRKSNMVHAWFVEHVQEGVDECQWSYVSHEKLEELRVTCLEVLAAGGTDREKEVIEEKLPPRAGFFFGGTEIDEWYWNDLQRTADLIAQIQAEPGHKYCSYFYHSSW